MPSITRSRSGGDRRAALDARVLAAVERLLSEGMKYTEISVARILEEAGIARSTFYVHFRDKTDILARLAGTLRQDLLEIAGRWEPGDGVEGLAAMFAESIAFHRQHSAVLLAITEAAAYDSGIRDFYSSDLDAFEAKVRQALMSEQSEGRTVGGVSVEAACRVIVWGGESAIAHHIQIDDGGGDLTFARELAALWWYGAFRRPAS
ncbi:TetR/AcrR family transcriptional regulator [Nonomuraea terrae]|uniref:TetR/AcrR family transcriptional regulator n=1 Tax=Nonomuraea terrae TaxID=2530383 RepID=UPI0037A7457B